MKILLIIIIFPLISFAEQYVGIKFIGGNSVKQKLVPIECGRYCFKIAKTYKDKEIKVGEMPRVYVIYKYEKGKVIDKVYMNRKEILACDAFNEIGKWQCFNLELDSPVIHDKDEKNMTQEEIEAYWQKKLEEEKK